MTVADEASIYRVISADHQGLARFLPSLCHYDRRLGLLVLRSVKRARAISDILNERGRISRSLTGELGLAVAAIHTFRSASPLPLADTPWIFSLPELRLERLRQMSSAQFELLRIVQESRALCRGLLRLRELWCPVSFIHGDLRLGNVLARRMRRRRWDLKIVDWELSGSGDPAWDIACVFADFLSLWVFSMPFVHGCTPGDLLRSARLPLARVQKAAQSFWSAYAAAQDIGSSEILANAGCLTGARLIQLAYERTQESVSLTGNAVTLIQLGANTMTHPQQAVSELLGID